MAEENEFLVTITGSIGHERRDITFDARDLILKRAVVRGEEMSPEELDDAGRQFVHDVAILREAVTAPPQPSTLQKVASRIGRMLPR